MKVIINGKVENNVDLVILGEGKDETVFREVNGQVMMYIKEGIMTNNQTEIHLNLNSGMIAGDDESLRQLADNIVKELEIR